MNKLLLLAIAEAAPAAEADRTLAIAEAAHEQPPKKYLDATKSKYYIDEHNQESSFHHPGLCEGECDPKICLHQCHQKSLEFKQNGFIVPVLTAVQNNDTCTWDCWSLHPGNYWNTVHDEPADNLTEAHVWIHGYINGDCEKTCDMSEHSFRDIPCKLSKDCTTKYEKKLPVQGECNLRDVDWRVYDFDEPVDRYSTFTGQLKGKCRYGGPSFTISCENGSLNYSTHCVMPVWLYRPFCKPLDQVNCDLLGGIEERDYICTSFDEAVCGHEPVYDKVECTLDEEHCKSCNITELPDHFNYSNLTSSKYPNGSDVEATCWNSDNEITTIICNDGTWDAKEAVCPPPPAPAKDEHYCDLTAFANTNTLVMERNGKFAVKCKDDSFPLASQQEIVRLNQKGDGFESIDGGKTLKCGEEACSAPPKRQLCTVKTIRPRVHMRKLTFGFSSISSSEWKQCVDKFRKKKSQYKPVSQINKHGPNKGKFTCYGIHKNDFYKLKLPSCPKTDTYLMD